LRVEGSVAELEAELARRGSGCAVVELRAGERFEPSATLGSPASR